jgi:hypothetical protein
MRESRRGLIEFVVARAEGVNEFLSSCNAIPSTARLWACGLASQQPSSIRIYRSRSTLTGRFMAPWPVSTRSGITPFEQSRRR